MINFSLNSGEELRALREIEKECSPYVYQIKEKQQAIKNVIESKKERNEELQNSLWVDIFPEELKQQNDFDFFVKKTFPEMKRKENLGPFEVAQLDVDSRNLKHVTTLKNWLK